MYYKFLKVIKNSWGKYKRKSLPCRIYICDKDTRAFIREEVQVFLPYERQISKLSSRISVLGGEFHKTFKKLAVRALSGLKHSCSVFKYIYVCMYVCMYVCTSIYIDVLYKYFLNSSQLLLRLSLHDSTPWVCLVHTPSLSNNQMTWGLLPLRFGFKTAVQNGVGGNVLALRRTTKKVLWKVN